MSVERVEIPVDPAVFAEWQTPSISDAGATAKELKEIWRCGDRTIRSRLEAARKAGVLRTGWRVITDLAGRQNRTPVYSFDIPKKKLRK